MKIVVLDGHVANPGDLSWDSLANMGELVVYDRTSPADIITRASGADAIFVNKVEISAHIIDNLPHLKFIGELATGYNNIDIKAARQHGITVCNVPGYSGDSVAQLVTALLLEITNRTAAYNESVHRGDWSACPDFSYTLGPITELASLTMGIYGYGNIGAKVGAIAAALGMKVITPTSKPQSALPHYARKVTFGEMLSNADVISVNAPLTSENKGLFNADNLARMKQGAILINTARGPIVDEQALADALRSGHLAAAATDVMAQEPPAHDNPLLAPDIASKIIITPHVAWQSVAARRRLLQSSASNLKAWIDGTPVNVVN
ncbi:MAG: D-2-hydroxyacid dehydrogenase [Odoribacter sp.]|nr:D-2-hydroxyacid dehydrogenase [Odoribacter sp.]